MFLIGLFVAVVIVVAIGGYTQGWDWTGFKGNTLRLAGADLLAGLIPLVVIPLVLGLRQSRGSEG